MLQHFFNARTEVALDRALDLLARFAAAEPLFEARAAGVNVLVQLFVDGAGALHQVLHADTVLASVLGSVLGFFAGCVIAPAVVVAGFGVSKVGGGVGARSGSTLRSADAGVMRMRVDDASVNNLEGVTTWQFIQGGYAATKEER